MENSIQSDLSYATSSPLVEAGRFLSSAPSHARGLRLGQWQISSISDVEKADLLPESESTKMAQWQRVLSSFRPMPFNDEKNHTFIKSLGIFSVKTCITRDLYSAYMTSNL